MTDAPSHGDSQAELAELALGILDGRERAALLDHLAGCPGCALELEQLTTAADELVHLAAEADPPVGFESRLFERLEISDPENVVRPGWGHRWRSVAAIAAALVLAFGVGWVVHPSDGDKPRSAVTAPSSNELKATLVSHGHYLGDASIYGNSPAWLFMAVEATSDTGRVRCTVTTADGRIHLVGSFTLNDGRGAWAAPLWVGKSPVRSAQVVDSGGRVLATANFA
jgi:hypothetical protein